jgi:hypothetical protein
MNLHNRQFQPGKSFNCLHPNDDKNGEYGGDGGCTDDSCGCFGIVCIWYLNLLCFGNKCTCIYCVLYCFVYVYLFLFVTSVKDYCHRVKTQLQQIIIINIIIIWLQKFRDNILSHLQRLSSPRRIP